MPRFFTHKSRNSKAPGRGSLASRGVFYLRLCLRTRLRLTIIFAASAVIPVLAIYANNSQVHGAVDDTLKPRAVTVVPSTAPGDTEAAQGSFEVPGVENSDSKTQEASKSDTIFIRSTLKDGRLESIDNSGRKWVYDSDLEMFRLRWVEAQSTRSARSEAVYLNEDDTIIVSRDRSDNWARDKKKVRRRSKKDVHVRETEFVLGNIRCQSSVRIDGLVEGDVIAVDEIVVTSTGIINGDARAPRIRVRKGGLITGREQTSTFFGAGRESDDENRELVNFGIFPIAGGIGLMLILVAFVSLSVAPKAVSLASDTISRHPLRTIGVGLLSIILAGPLIGLVAVTIIGIPLALLLIIGFPIALLVGIISFSQYIGGVSAEAYGLSGWSNIKRITIGILLMITLLGAGITLGGSSSDFLSGWGVVLIIVGVIFMSAAVLSGFGAVVLTRFGRREYAPAMGNAWTPGVPPPPPPPTPPPIPISSDPPLAPSPPDLPDTPQPPRLPDSSAGQDSPEQK